MSNITGLELLVGAEVTQPTSFQDGKERIQLAYDLSRGRVLEDPRILICKEILGIPFPADQLAPAAKIITRNMDIIRRAKSMEELTTTGIPYKLRAVRMIAADAVRNLMVGPKRAWIAAVERMADEYYPTWRKLYQETGKRVPPEVRKQLTSQSTWHPQRRAFVESLLEWLHAPGISRAGELCERLDAVIDFTIFVSREFLIGRYVLENHQSDVSDMFQLQYLAMDRFIIVTHDPDLTYRTRNSRQASRIMSFDQFMCTL